VPHFKFLDILKDFPAVQAYLKETSQTSAVQNTSCESGAIIQHWLMQGVQDPHHSIHSAMGDTDYLPINEELSWGP